MNTGLFGITWAAYERMYYVPIVCLLIMILIYQYVRREKAITLLARIPFMNRMIMHTSNMRRFFKMVLYSIACIALFLAFLQPQWGKKEEIVEQEGRDLFIALDISKSMLAQDVSPDRLQFAKYKIRKLLQQLSCERVGLILFSGSTFVQCPLTTDYGAFHLFLDQIDVETISSGTTALDQAIKQAIQAFEHGAQRKHKLLVICTDGEDFSSNLSGVKQSARDMGLHIFTLGIGTVEGAPIPLKAADGTLQGHQLDKKGKVVISKLNEGMLRTLSQDSGGMYQHVSTHTNDDIDALVRAVQLFEKEKMDDKKVSHYHEQYPYFVAVSFICLLLEWLL